MTNKEAANFIKAKMNMNQAVFGHPVGEPLKTAYETAISALEFKERYDRFWEEVKTAGMNGKETEIRHSGRVFRIREVAQ